MHYTFRSTPTWTIHGRPFTTDKSCQPGPAEYNVNKPINRQASYSVVNEKRQFFKTTTDTFPGPGSYNQKSFMGEGPKRSMSARTLKKMERTPGPGQYDNDSLKLRKTQPNFSIPGQSKSTINCDKNKTPGPTDYSCKGLFDNEKNKPGILIGSEKRRGLSDTENTPAPGYYKSEIGDQYLGKQTPQYSMGKEGINNANDQKNQTPGPGKYEKKSLFDDNKQSKRGFSCRGRPFDKVAQERQNSPGPGQYHASMFNKASGPKFAETKDSRKTYIDDMSNSKKGFPGPGNNGNFNLLSNHPSATSFNFNKSQRLPLSNGNTPGPCGYEPYNMDIFKSSPKFTIGKANDNRQNPESPGPTTYNPTISLVKQSTAIYQMGKEHRLGSDNKNLMPGPGNYSLISKTEGPGWIFPKEMRSAFTDKVGDGGKFYEIPSKIPDPPTYMNVKPKIYGRTNWTTSYKFNRSNNSKYN